MICTKQLRVRLFILQELNSVYNIKKEQELQSHQSHLLQNIRNNNPDQSYNQTLIESYGGQVYPEHHHQLDTHHLSHSHQVTHYETLAPPLENIPATPCSLTNNTSL